MVFYISLTIVAFFVLWGSFSPANLTKMSKLLLGITIEKFGWFYLITTFSILIFTIYLAFSKYGKIRLGAEEDRPEYSDSSWFAMLLSAGMGIGLVFWGVAEPVQHYINPPLGIEGRTPEAALAAMRYALFYWSWWIAWAPFVGMFIARVSKGRTIKEFVFGVLLLPSLFSFIWFSVFGGTALNLEISGNYAITEAVSSDVTSALFITLRQLPFGTVVSLLATLLIMTFFITSADSATFVLGMLSSNGDLNPKNRIKLIWGILQSSIAVILLISGGLEGLQTMAIITALPFAVILALLCFSFMKALRSE